MTKRSSFPLVAVEWEDTTSAQEWLTTEQVIMRRCDCVVTIGWLVQRTKDQLHLAATWSHDEVGNVTWNDVNVIKTVNVVRIATLKVPSAMIPLKTKTGP